MSIELYIGIACPYFQNMGCWNDLEPKKTREWKSTFSTIVTGRTQASQVPCWIGICGIKDTYQKCYVDVLKSPRNKTRNISQSSTMVTIVFFFYTYIYFDFVCKTILVRVRTIDDTERDYYHHSSSKYLVESIDY